MDRSFFAQAITFLVVMLLCSCTESSTEKGNSEGTVEYTVLNEEIDESPGKTQLIINILISEDVSEDELGTLLNSLYEKANHRTGFKYHSNPTVIGIYAYPSREHAEAGMGQWLGMLTKTPTNEQSLIQVHFSVGQEDASSESRFGFTVDGRKDIYKRIVSTEDRGQKEAEKRYPSDLRKQFDFVDELSAKYKKDLATELGITKEQLDEIAQEGVLNNWPMPKMGQ